MDTLSAQPTPPPRSWSILGRVGIGAFSLIAANAGFLVLYLAYDLKLVQLVVAYWCECFFIGVFSALKLLVASVIGDPFENRYAEVSKGANLFLSVLAIWFTGGAFLSLFGMVGLLIFSPIGAGVDQTGMDLVADNVGVVLGLSLVLAFGHAVSFVINFLIFGEYERARVGALLALPFKRCLALLGAVLVAIAVIQLFPGMASSAVFAAILIVLKIIGDHRLHLAERASLSRGSRAGA